MALLAPTRFVTQENTPPVQQNLFWVYEQTPNRAQYIVDKEKGLSFLVFIEASTAASADAKAVMLGIYFDGIENGIDCACCGPRWFPAEQSVSTPEIFGFNVAGQFKHADQYLKPAVEALIKQSAMMSDPLDPLAFMHTQAGSVIAFKRPRLIIR